MPIFPPLRVICHTKARCTVWTRSKTRASAKLGQVNRHAKILKTSLVYFQTAVAALAALYSTARVDTSSATFSNLVGNPLVFSCAFRTKLSWSEAFFPWIGLNDLSTILTIGYLLIHSSYHDVVFGFRVLEWCTHFNVVGQYIIARGNSVAKVMVRVGLKAGGWRGVHWLTELCETRTKQANGLRGDGHRLSALGGLPWPCSLCVQVHSRYFQLQVLQWMDIHTWDSWDVEVMWVSRYEWNVPLTWSQWSLLSRRIVWTNC